MSSKNRPMGPVPCHRKSDSWDRSHRSNFEVHGTSSLSYTTVIFDVFHVKSHVTKNYGTGPMSSKIRPMGPVPCHWKLDLFDRPHVSEKQTYGKKLKLWDRSYRSDFRWHGTGPIGLIFGDMGHNMNFIKDNCCIIYRRGPMHFKIIPMGLVP